MNFVKTKQFEEAVFAVNKEILIRFMGGGNVVSTDYLSGELAVFDIMGIDKVFSVSGGEHRTTSLRVRQDDWSNITIRGHISHPNSQARKIFNITAKGCSYADYTLQVNGVDSITYEANSTMIRINNRYLSSLMVRLERQGLLENYFVDKGEGCRFYDFSYQTLQKYSVVPFIVIVTPHGFEPLQ